MESRFNVDREGQKKGEQMVRKRFVLEQIINKLREAEIPIIQGIPIAEASKKSGVIDGSPLAKE